MIRIFSLLILGFFVFAGGHDLAFAQNQVDPLAVVTENTDKVSQILKGPIFTLGGAVILLVGVAGLLRGRYKLAVSCAIAYAALLFLNRPPQ